MPRRRLPIYLPALLLLIVAVGWCIFWWVASSRLEASVDHWLQREAAAGRIYDCGSRDVGGFPFRLEIDCLKPVATLPADGGSINLSAERLVAVAQIYRPTHVIGQFEGPLTASYPDLPQATAEWSFAGASFSGNSERLENVSLVVDGLSLKTAQTQEPIVTTTKLEAHARPTPEAGAGAYDLIARMDEAAIPFVNDLLGSAAPTDLELQASIRGLDSIAGATTAERLQAFAASGGNLRIALARLARGDVALQSVGQLMLDDSGRPTGELDVTVRGAEKLASFAPSLGDLGPLAGAGIKLLGQKTTLDGESARRFDVRLEDGVIRLGGLPVGPVPSLY
ncbi:hypothetical protein GCM10007276_30130 [Agaricicola taiwanensis]|uniref:DUF2125 domain-containing protein n=1 Tax=Agaricicola taiwanensis TaxID=591372 RepID=A0A8J2YL51_9RHOB|nr:DUF2125 domain-containing protein [Agaricicola taiwanensis]GGE51075.1 hypothetical protein GCM10007276_30130 [Agaricicola taiwanensis]